jgi:hypothetical protein
MQLVGAREAPAGDYVTLAGFILSHLHELAPARRSLYRAYKIPPAPLSNSYAPMRTCECEIKRCRRLMRAELSVPGTGGADGH